MTQTHLYLSPSPGSKLHSVTFFAPNRAGAASGGEMKFDCGNCSLLSLQLPSVVKSWLVPPPSAVGWVAPLSVSLLWRVS